MDNRFTIVFLTIPFLAAAYFLLIYLFGHLKLKLSQEKSQILRAPKRKLSAEEEFWHNIATSIFEQAGQNISQEVRIESALRAGATRLRLGHALLLRHLGDTYQIISMATTGYAKPLQFDIGEEVSRNLLFNGHLSSTRDMMTIDFASLSEWRKHPAYRDLSCESFIGYYKEGVLEHPVSICFFDSRPRDHLFSKQDKDFVVQLSRWIFAILQNESALLANADKALQKETKLASIS